VTGASQYSIDLPQSGMVVPYKLAFEKKVLLLKMIHYFLEAVILVLSLFI